MSFSLTMSMENLQRGHGGAFAVAGLEHEQLAFLDGELDVLHVLEMASRESRGRSSVPRRTSGMAFLSSGDRLRRADAGDDIFALRVDEEFAVEFILAIGRVAGEGDAGAGVFRRCCR